MTATPTTPALHLVDAGFRWTNDRVAAVDRLDLPTPCTEFDLRALLHHLTESLQRFTMVLSGAPAGELPDEPVAAYEVAQRQASAAWQRADLARTYVMPIGELPGELVAMLSATEVVVHGWDIGRATGEDAEIPAELAEPLLAFSSGLLDDASRGDAFGPAVPGGDSPSQRLVRFLGRA